MGKLVANLLDFSRSRHTQISTVDVSEEIDKTLELINYYFKKRNIQVQRDSRSRYTQYPCRPSTAEAAFSEPFYQRK